jgi:hypothetical protein
MGIVAVARLTGVVFVVGYSSYFFELAGLSTSSAFSLSVGVSVLGLLGVICSWFLINKTGRRSTTLVGVSILNPPLPYRYSRHPPLNPSGEDSTSLRSSSMHHYLRIHLPAHHRSHILGLVRRNLQFTSPKQNRWSLESSSRVYSAFC